jgi:CBS domain-containing protein
LASAHGIINPESPENGAREEAEVTISAILQRKGRNVVSVQANATVRDAIALLAERRIGALPVMNGREVAGVISERDVVYCLFGQGPAVLDWPVSKVMTSPAITVTPDVPVLGALSQMSRRRIRHLPVVEGEELIGIVSIGDLVQYRIERVENEAEAMRAYISGS